MNQRFHPENGDELLARELEQALAVDYSPQFRARVRARVARESMRVRWLWPYGAVSAAAVAVAILMTVVLSPDAPIASPQLSEGTPVERAVVTPVEPKGASPERAVAPEAVTGRSIAVPPARAARLANPVEGRAAVVIPPPAWLGEVVISAAEADALRRLFESAGAGELEEPRQPELSPSPPPVLSIDEIVIDPIPLHTLSPSDSGERGAHS